MVASTRRGTALAASVLLVGSLAAQNPLPVPASHVAMEGSASTNVPFGRSIPTRVQYVYDAMLFAGPVTITGVQFRLDGGAVVGNKTVDCEISMSTLPTSLVALSPQFAQNRGGDEVQVLPRQILTLPAQATGATPNPYLTPITFATPFAYDPQNGGLVLEVVVHGQPPGAYSLDVTYVCNSPMVPVGPASCLQSNGLPLGVESVTTGVQWGRPWITRAFDVNPGNIIVLALGTQETGTWAGLQLPQDLGVAGASGCFVSIDVAVSFYDTAAPDGTATFPFAIPNDPQVLGEWLRFQAGTFDAAANPLGLVTSQAKKVQVCGWEPVGRVWSNGISAAFGTLEIGLSAVVQFTTQ
ncbi:MAG: hypothetical protein KAI24_22955 [Planctomycetes bacterium]|nr:hypothetical protein [Planctomycetota bacterium]